jgi:hypothetical protein
VDVQEASPVNYCRASENLLPSIASHAKTCPGCESKVSTSSLATSFLTQTASKKVAEGLYQKGFLSYPRTETDSFDKDFNFSELIEKHVTDAQWGQFAQSCVPFSPFLSLFETACTYCQA